MIKTFWDSAQDELNNALKTPIIIDAVGGSNLQPQVIDLAKVQNRGDLSAIELEVTTVAVAPGASKNLTPKYAFSSVGNRTPTELSTAAASQACELANSLGVLRTYSLPVSYMGAQFLYLWFDCDALTANARLHIRARVNAKVA